MKLSTRVSLGFSLLMLGAVTCITCLCYGWLESSYRLNFVRRYETLASLLAFTLQQLEVKVDATGRNAARVFYELDATHGAPMPPATLAVLAGELGVDGLHVLSGEGVVLTSTNPQLPRLAGLCATRAELLGSAHVADVTPFLPTASEPASKFITLASRDGARLLQVSILSHELRDILANLLGKNPEVLAAGLYTATGLDLQKAYTHQASVETHAMVRAWPVHADLGDRIVVNLQVPSSVSACSAQRAFYRLRLEVSTEEMALAVSGLRRAVGLAFVATTLTACALARLLAGRIARHVEQIRSAAAAIVESGDLGLQTRLDDASADMLDVARAFQEMGARLKSQQDRLLENERLACAAKVAAQVAHDMRSPLSAITMVLSDLHQPSEETRSLLRSAIHRIQDIANELLTRHRDPNEEEGSWDVARPVLLSSLIETIISEKRTQWRKNLNVEIVATTDSNTYGLFAAAKPSVFKRVLSSLINNAVAAIDGRGRVVVSLSSHGSHIAVSVSDDGRGMAEGLLARLNGGEPSSGDNAGAGLGVTHAHEAVAGWGGKLTFASALGRGSTATVTVPRAPDPEWFLRELDLEGTDTVVVLDDDVSIHGIWTKRLGTAVRLVHLSTPDELRAWVATAASLARVRFLVDFDLLTFEETGLDLVQALGLVERSVLVTGRFEEGEVLARLRALHMRLIPKPVAAHIPVVLPVAPPKQPDCVLLDDDRLVHNMWQKAAKRADKRLAVYASPDTLMAQLDALPRHTPIYVDADLGHRVRGEEVTRQLAEQGFTRLFLATGYSRMDAGNMPWLSGVLGKDPPF